MILARRSIGTGTSGLAWMRRALPALAAITTVAGHAVAAVQPGSPAPAALSASPSPAAGDPPAAGDNPAATSPPELDLDVLLGLKPAGGGESGGASLSPDEQRAALERKLALTQSKEAFEEAIELMGRAADRLETHKDPGIDTQRLQEEAIRKLDQVIKQAEQQQQQQRQKQKQKQQQQQQQSQPQSSQQQQQQSQNDERRGDNREEMAPPSRRDGELGAAAARGAAWGSLPARVRESLMQGTGDRYSSLYDRLTKLYYQRLAEEKPR